MFTYSNLMKSRRLISFLSSLMLFALLLLTAGVANSSVTWVTQSNTSTNIIFNNYILSMSSDGSVLSFYTASTVFGGSGSGNAVVKRLVEANPVAVPGFIDNGTFFPWLSSGGGYVGFFGSPDTDYDAGIYKLVPGAATATNVDLNKNTAIAAVLSDSGTLGAYLSNPGEVYDHIGSGTVYYGTTNLGSSTSTISASADVSKIAYRNGNTFYYYGGSGVSATTVVLEADGSNYHGPALSADGTRIAFPSSSSQISIRASSALTTSIYTLAGEAPLALSSDGTILACKKSAANAIVIYKNGIYIGEITTSGNAAPLEISVSTSGKYIGYVATNTIKHVYQWKNELPTLNNISNPAAIDMDTAATQTINLAGIASGDNTNESQTLTVSAAVTGGTNTNLLKNLAVTYSTGATGSITYNANDNQVGTAIVTVTVSDGIDTITKTFTVTVNPNKQPTLDAISDPAAILEDDAEQTVNLSGITSGSANEVQTLTVTATSSNTALIPDPVVTYTSAQTTGTLKYTPVANIFGSAVITVKVKDNGGTAFNGVDEITRTFTVNVSLVNDVPSFTKGADVTVLEDSAAYSAAWATGISAGPANESAQAVNFIVTNDNNALFSTQPAVSATGVLSFTLAADANGAATVTIQIHDNGGVANGGVDTSAAQTCTITVTAVNDVPSFTKGADVSVAEDSGAYSATWTTDISSGPANESAQLLDFIVTNDNNALFSTQPAVSSTGVLSFVPVANAKGAATVTVKIHDDGGVTNGGVDTSVAQTFTITVSSVNDVPSFTKGADITVLEDAAAYSNAWATGISAGPANESAQAVDFIVTNDNNALFSTQPAFSATGVLTFTPAADANGAATVTVQIHDNGGTANSGVDTSAAQTFTITVTAVNDAPSFTSGGNVWVLEDSGAYSAACATAISAGPANEAGQAVDFIVTNHDNWLFSVQPAVSATGVLTFTPAANANGLADVTVTIHDNGGTANGGVNTSAHSFLIIVTAVNDVPSFTKSADVTVLEDSGAFSAAWATGISSGPADESGQAVDFIVTNDNNGLFSTQPAISSTGLLTFTPAVNANGVATVTVQIHDNGGTANGGVDTSVAQTFTITVTAVNDVPSFTKGSDITVLEDAAYSNAWATGISAGAANESAQVLDFIVSNDNNALFSTQPAVSSAGVLSFVPAANAYGAATVTVQIHDNGGTANGGVETSATQTFTITVTTVNDAPSFSKGADITVFEDSAAYSADFATAISAGPTDESGQTVNFIVSNDNNSLFSAQPVISAAGTLSFTPVANANGSATVTVQIHDNGGTLNGGVDTSAAQTFTITISATNDIPTLDNIADPATIYGGNAGEQTILLSGISPGPANESAQTMVIAYTSNNTAMIPSGAVAYSQGSSTAILRFTPVIGIGGIADITVTVYDNLGASVSKTFTQIIAVNLTSVALSSNKPSPQIENTAVELTATPTGGTFLTYKFTATNSATKAVILLSSGPSGYQNGNTVTWTPTASGIYLLRVDVHDSRNGYSTYKYIYYTIYSASLVPGDSVTLTTGAINSPQPLSIGTIALTADVVNGTGEGLRYKFTAINTKTNVSVILGTAPDANGYQGATTVDWTPTESGIYLLRVDVLDPGNGYSTYKYIYYTIYSASLVPGDSVTLTTGAINSPQPLSIGTIALTADVVNGTGEGLRYKFRAINTKTNVSVILGTAPDANGYQGATTVDWTPTESGIYLLRVDVHDPNNGYSAYKYIYYTIYSASLVPGDSVTLTTGTVNSPQPLSIGTIALTADVVNGTGEGLRYKFRAINTKTNVSVILGTAPDANGYQGATTVDWTPTESGIYLLRVDVLDPSNGCSTYKYIYYTIYSASLVPGDSVTLTTGAINSPQPLSIGTIELTADVINGTGEGLRYKFRAINTKTNVSVILGTARDANGYQGATTVDWTPTASGIYLLRVDVFDPSNGYSAYKYIFYTIL